MKSSLSIVCLALCMSLVIGAHIDIEVSDTELPPTPFCAAQCLLSGIYDLPHFNSCNQFYRCIHGFFFEFSCASGEVFDHITLTCLPGAQARCILRGPVLIPA